MKWRCVHTRKSYQRPLVGKAAHISNFSHELWAGDFTCALHGYNEFKFREQSGQAEHLGTYDMQGIINGVQAVHGLGNKQFGAVILGGCRHTRPGSFVDFLRVGLREPILFALAPFLVSDRKCVQRNTSHAVSVPEAFHKIYPFDMPVGARRVVK